MVFDSIPVGYLGTNCYLLGDEETGTCALIDPGDEENEILRMVERSGLTLTKVFLTHGHFDHFTALPKLQAVYPNLPFYIHPNDVSGEEKITARVHYACPVLPGMKYYAEGDTVAVGAIRLTVLETPGHTSGSITLKTEGKLFTGDTLFSGACGRTDLPRGNMDDMKESLRKLARLPGDYLVYPGHGESTTLETERRTNPYMRNACR